MSQTKGFILSIVIVMVIFIVTASTAGILAGFAGLWKKPIIGAVAAFCVVVSGYISAPSHKQWAAGIWLVVGAIAAWFLSGDSYYPEDHQHAYQLTYIPLVATYLSGLCALLLCLYYHKKQAIVRKNTELA